MPENSCGYTPYFWCLYYTPGFPLISLEPGFPWQYPLWYLASFTKFTSQFCSMSHSFITNLTKLKPQFLLIFVHYACKNYLIEINWTAHMSKNLASGFISDVQKTTSTSLRSCNLIKYSICWKGKAEYKRFLC